MLVADAAIDRAMRGEGADLLRGDGNGGRLGGDRDHLGDADFGGDHSVNALHGDERNFLRFADMEGDDVGHELKVLGLDDDGAIRAGRGDREGAKGESES